MQLFKNKLLGHLVELAPNDDTNAALVYFCPQGSACEMALHREDFYAMYEPATAPAMQNLMNPHTGTVQTAAEWAADGFTTANAEFIEVVKDANGDWAAA